MRRLSLKQKTGLVLFGIFLCFLLLEAGLRIAGFLILSIQEHRNKKALSRNGEYLIMCIGESTTARGGEDSYPRQLEEILNGKSTGTGFRVINKGIEGVESGTIVSRLEKNLDKYMPNMLMAMMGVNDSPGTTLYEETLKARSELFLKDLRIHKLIRSIRSNLANKIIEIKDEYLINDMISLNEVYFKYKSQGRFEKIEKMLKKRMEKNPDNAEIFFMLGNCYREQARHKEAREILKKAVALDPEYATAYLELGLSYANRGEIRKAEKMFKKAIKSNGLDYGAYVELGILYIDQKRYKEAEKILSKAVKIDPKYEPTYTMLGVCYRQQGRSDKIQELSEMIIKEDIKNDRLYGFVATHYKEQGEFEEADKYYEKANKFREEYYDRATRHNYKKLNDITEQRGVKLVCVQYPVRSVKPLKKLFDSTEGIIFVGNEKIFKEALEKASYDEYFTDNFGGEFGHCTRKGNRLLAENIADTISREHFQLTAF